MVIDVGTADMKQDMSNQLYSIWYVYLICHVGDALHADSLLHHVLGALPRCGLLV